jgi:hypothetical protein
MKSLIKAVVYCAFILSVGSLFAATPSVTLSWTPSTNATTTTPGTANVYRLTGTCPASVTTVTSFTQLATSQPDGGPYTDSSVALGSTYCYVVTAVIGGVESVPSNTFQAVMSAQPAPPTGLKGTVVQ